MSINRLPGLLLACLRLLVLLSSLILTVSLGVLLKWIHCLPSNLGFTIRRFWCRLALIILGIRVKNENNPDLNPGTLYVSNHRSLVDPLILFAFIKNGYVISKAEVRDYPVIGTGADLSGVVYIDRSDKDSRNASKTTILKTLLNKLSVTIFPEGTVSISKELLPYRKGAFEAAVSSGSQVVAVALEYMNPKKDFWFSNHLLTQFLVTFSKPITTVKLYFFEAVTGNDAIELCNQIHDVTQTKIFEFQENWKKENIPESFRNKV
ncbi:MAG: lysophospholipid acyltransferase family protein [Saprospiraceae bacterium]